MKIQTVDEYIAAAPEETREKLKEMREIIRSVAPMAEEKISYSMPYYGYKGRLVYFGFAKKHVGLYLPPPVVENHAEELKMYETSKSAVQFPLAEKLPVALIKKLVVARIKINDAIASEKK